MLGNIVSDACFSAFATWGGISVDQQRLALGLGAPLRVCIFISMCVSPPWVYRCIFMWYLVEQQRPALLARCALLL